MGLRLSAAVAIVASISFDAIDANAATRSRHEIPLPDIPGYTTLRCDFHLHTVFSDGNVWPSVRVEEAWRNGLDAIAISDHIEYLPHKADVPTNFGRAYELARGPAKTLGILLVPAAEITRGEPPGHLNALFVTNVPALNQTNYLDAIRTAVAQGAFLFWNHPGWKQPDKVPVFYKEQNGFMTNGWVRGIEIVNGDDYYALAHTWSVERNLAVLGNTDAHDPIQFGYNRDRGELQPLTLVFAKERNLEGIREALLAQRTAVLHKGGFYGPSELLKPIFHKSIEVVTKDIRIKGKGSALVQIRNTSAVDFVLRLNPKLPELDVPEPNVLLPAGRIGLLPVRCVSDRVTGQQVLSLPCRVLNMHTTAERFLSTSLVLTVNYD